ncbi:phosphate metabolism protein 7 [Stygiomarasmius scandens]|uniref:Phosphate metabolism protein 7 n=1 Tax=Marasmiellus scandens TaxID=2682957 RepID=A0ABR1JE68_9AGAR
MAVDPNRISNSSKSFMTALIANGALLGIEVGAFLVMKSNMERIFSPRTYLPPPDKRSKPLPKGLWRWLPAVLMSPSEDIIHKNGLDAYMFLRYIKLLIKIFFVFTILTFAVVVPVNFVGRNDAPSNLERITWTNLAETAENQPRFFAHVFVVYVLTFYVIYEIRSEMSHFTYMRHQFLLSPSHSAHAQARTVLLTSVPDEIANEHDLRQFASFVPGGVDKVWVYRDTKQLNDWFEERQGACSKLEGAVVTLLKKAMKNWRRREKGWNKSHKKSKSVSMRKGKGKSQSPGQEGEKGEEVNPDVDLENQDDEDEMPVLPPTKETLDELVPENKRPRHRTGFLGLFGEKVDTIDWCKEEIATLNGKIRQGRAKLVEGKSLGSVFILCNLQMGAHILAQCVSYHEPLTMIDKWIEIHPKDIVWRNLDDGALEMRWRYLTSWLAMVGLIIAWSFPAVFIGTLSNVDELCHNVHFLSWVCTNLSSTVQSIIQGILPPVLLAILFALLPLVLRALAYYECIPRYSLMSMSVYKRLFIFLLIHGFLIVTISSGVTKAIEEIINNPTLTLQSLAHELPGASVFFLSYMITQGLAGAGMALIQLVPLIIHYFRKFFMGRTPRQAFLVTFRMPSIDFGETLPRLSLLATIAFAYSVLNPLINFLALISYVMMYIAYKFLFLQVMDQPDQSETGGLYFPVAMSNLFVGLYIEEVSLACLFFLKASTSALRPIALPQGILMVFLIAFTAIAQGMVGRSYNPITRYLPMSLATKQMAERYGANKKDGHGSEDEDGDMDLFSRSHITSVRRRITKKTKNIPMTVIGGTLGTIGHLTAKASAKVGVAVGRSSGVSEHEDHEMQPRASSSSASPISPQTFPTVAIAGPSSAGIRPSISPGPDDSVHEEPQQMEEHHEEQAHEDEHHDSMETPLSPPPSRPISTPSLSFPTPKPFRRPSEIVRKFSSFGGATPTDDASDHPYEQIIPPRPIPKRSDTSFSSFKRREKGESTMIVPPPPAPEEEEDLDDHAFDHPSTYVEQPWIWVPKDKLGLSKVIIKELQDAGVSASDEGATMDRKGVVEVTRNPPDEEWAGGHTH